MFQFISLMIVALIYLAVAVVYGCEGKWGMCLAFVAYSIANLGLYWAGSE